MSKCIKMSYLTFSSKFKHKINFLLVMPPSKKSQNMRISQMRLNFNLSLKLLLDLIIYQLTLEIFYTFSDLLLAAIVPSKG